MKRSTKCLIGIVATGWMVVCLLLAISPHLAADVPNRVGGAQDQGELVSGADLAIHPGVRWRPRDPNAPELLVDVKVWSGGDIIRELEGIPEASVFMLPGCIAIRRLPGRAHITVLEATPVYCGTITVEPHRLRGGRR